jgi:hypothetical protein
VTSFQGAAVAAIVLVVVDGTVLPSAPPAVLRAGRVIAPVTLLARIADRVDAAEPGTVTAARGDLRCTAPAISGAEPAFVAIAPMARCLGATHVAFDGRTKTLALTFRTARNVRTPSPFDPSAPQVSPTTVFTPEPAPPTPRAIVTGSPHPRRTAIPVFASPAAPTSPRPKVP